MYSHRSALPVPEQRNIYRHNLRRSQDQRSGSTYGGYPRPSHITSPTSSPHGFAASSHRMDQYGSKSGQQTLPPLLALMPQGTLYYVDGTAPHGTKITFDIHGVIDKGFFLADHEWTCYRRNYFSCVCSFSLSPPTHSWPTTPAIQFVQESNQAAFTVSGFAMSISAVVSDNDTQTIDLVQHTPKRDKGPISAPEKVRLSPKSAGHPHLSVFPQPDGTLRGTAYEFSQGQTSTPTEHTFERIQFKQATANNGKRRAAQQYYHLVVELWADVSGSQSSGAPQWVKVGYKKSAKMIVRGRSPGHYQSERRGSASSGPGGASGNLGYGSLGPEFTSAGSGIMGSTFGHSTTYDPRGSAYGSSTRHSQEVGVDTIMTDDHKPMHDSKEYHYYPNTIYENGHNVEMFQHSSRDHQVSSISHTLPNPTDHHSKVKPEYDSSRTLYHPGPQWSRAGPCGRYESKNTSNGFYPTVPSSGLNMT
ncbi:hypothetical protein, variant [Gaeumannomyces tritici R3-111a-1]|nr:hypothetical protein, variant [Gaeumannomyces tritici R3-111a-1]EJT74664.1 hypothetical protein, variant [Gaeumannomyces tritici R3-111a-1]